MAAQAYSDEWTTDGDWWKVVVCNLKSKQEYTFEVKFHIEKVFEASIN